MQPKLPDTNLFETMMNIAKTKTPKEKIDNTQLLKDTGLRIRHIRRNSREFPDSTATRDVTIAYRDGGDTIEIATAVVHPNDCFSRKMGTKLAVEGFQAGKVTRIPKTIDYGMGSLVKASALRTINLLFGW
jgi:hypothetical protein